ncbi:MAG TPA: DUF4082 domain-containing protein, partial [Chloroflexota bacterium]|nr:DUF4082 domain-containing protein [Chloroflexota bacterium]
VSFTNESALGWQTATFATPIAIKAHTTYVASYNDNTKLGYTYNSLTSSVSNGPLSTVADGKNGVVGRTPGSFPTIGTRGTNYFADVVFTAS